MFKFNCPTQLINSREIVQKYTDGQMDRYIHMRPKTAEEETLCDVTYMPLPLNVFASLFKCSSEANTKLAKNQDCNLSCFLEGFYVYIHLRTWQANNEQEESAAGIVKRGNNRLSCRYVRSRDFISSS